MDSKDGKAIMTYMIQMRRFFVGSIGFLGVCIQINAHFSSQEAFLRANRLYETGDYQHALSAYDMVPSKGVATWFNMGNAWFQLGDYAQAHACWRRAEPSASLKELAALATRYDLLRETLGYEEHATWYEHAYMFIRRLALVSPFLLVQLGILLVLYALFFMGYFGKKSRMKTSAQVFLWLCLGVLVLICSVRYHVQNERAGIVAQHDVGWFAGPDAAYHRRGVLPYAVKLRIEKECDDWYRVCWNGMTGWVKAAEILEL